jgi:hypothetical protein
MLRPPLAEEEVELADLSGETGHRRAPAAGYGQEVRRNALAGVAARLARGPRRAVVGRGLDGHGERVVAVEGVADALEGQERPAEAADRRAQNQLVAVARAGAPGRRSRGSCG